MSDPIEPKHLCGTCFGWKLKDNREEFTYQCRNRLSPNYMKYTTGEETCRHWRILRDLTIAKW